MNKEIYSESLFIDSGAFSLYNNNILKQGKRWGQGDFSYYNLSKGTEFRQYCDSYAGFMKKFADRKMLFANVDVISNPELTWQIQNFFEEVHGLSPIPIVHHGCPMKYVDHYLARKYTLLGVGGLAHIGHPTYIPWLDQLFVHLCPKSNNYMPVIRTHGFAVTAWEGIYRYPWWSVDSTSWVKYAAYGWLCLPRWSERTGFRYDLPPWVINFSFRSPSRADRHKHYHNIPTAARIACDKWLKHVGMEIGSVNKKGKMVKYGVSSHHGARSTANLIYFKELEESRPKWPHPLDNKLVTDLSVKYGRGFGL